MIAIPEGVRLTEPQRRLIAEIERYGKAEVVGSRHVSAETLRRKGVPIEIVAETHDGVPCVPFASREPWHFVARAEPDS